MAYVKVECCVSRNHKFIVAGPAPSWLWLCGLCYCQESLTDGFIPESAIEFLGVKNAKRLTTHLVAANLWEEVPGGWHVHDYLEHNKSAHEVNGIKVERRKAGSIGGHRSVDRRASKQSAEANAKQLAEANVKQTVEANAKNPLKQAFNPYVRDVVASASDAVAEEGGSGETLDVAFEAFKAAYPGARKVFGFLEQSMYAQAVQSGKTTPDKMLEALENHKASAQWQDASKIPNPRTWLQGERWNQRLPSAAETAQVAVNAKLPAWART